MTPETFKDKLLHYEVSPPAGAWEVISVELAQNKELLNFSKKLFTYEVPPPPHSWKEIENSLVIEKRIQNKSPAKVLKSYAYQIMAAATILGVILTGSIHLYRSNLLKNKMAAIESVSPKNNEIKPEKPATTAASAFRKTTPDQIPFLSARIKPKPGKNYKENKKALQNTTVKNPLITRNEAEIMIAAKPIRNVHGDIIQDSKIMNNANSQYISITGPNGQQTKISSKFMHMLLYINNDNDIDEVDGYFDKNFLESLIWKSRFHAWRDKIINTSLVPSSANFMDILEFKDLITQEN